MRSSSKEVSSASSTAPNSRFSSASLSSSIPVVPPEPSVGLVSFQPGTSGGPTTPKPAALVYEELEVLLREREEGRARVAAAADCEEVGFHGLAEAEAGRRASSALLLDVVVVAVGVFDLGRVAPADAGFVMGRIMPYGVYAERRIPLSQSAKTFKRWYGTVQAGVATLFVSVGQRREAGGAGTPHHTHTHTHLGPAVDVARGATHHADGRAVVRPRVRVGGGGTWALQRRRVQERMHARHVHLRTMHTPRRESASSACARDG
jgi:hypothetical protein